ncbi:MAG: NAD(P)-dependent oxidoreductase [Chthoniobacterales bacterium]
MKVCFVSTEPDEEGFFTERLARWEPVFVRQLDEVPADVEVLSIFIYDGIEERFLASHPGLKLIVTRSAGADHIDAEACRKHGVKIACGGGSDGNNVAEHTFALLLAVARRLRLSNERRSGDFSHQDLRGFELRGKTLGLIGVGRIGARVAALARAFEMKIVAYDPNPAAHVDGLRYASLDDVLGGAEILSLHAPLTAATRHLLDAAALAKCTEGVVIINTARGALIDTEALVKALESGQVGGVGLDVLEDERVLRAGAKEILTSQIVEHVHQTDRPGAAQQGVERKREIARLFFNDALLARPEVVFTPHIAFNTTENIEAICGTVAKNIEDFLAAGEVA